MHVPMHRGGDHRARDRPIVCATMDDPHQIGEHPPGATDSKQEQHHAGGNRQDAAEVKPDGSMRRTRLTV